MVKILRDGLRKILPPNAHELATGKLHVSLTRFTDGENVLISNFDTREELIQAVICSTFVPFYCGTVPPSFKGVRYIDGGLSDNLPVLDGETITVSPFSGETDICPADADSGSFLGIKLKNTSFRCNARNLYRFSVALFPPHPEVMSQMCRQGFEDALKFLAKNDLISCMRCLEVRSCITLPEESLKSVPASPPSPGRKKTQLPRTYSSRKLCGNKKRSISTPNLVEIYLRSESECDSCFETAIGAPKKGLPRLVKHELEDAEALDKTLLGYFLRLRPVKWLRYLTIPWLLPWDITYVTCIKLLEWLPSLPKDVKWLVERMTEAARFVLKEIDSHRHLYSARFTCQLAVTELSYGGAADLSYEEYMEGARRGSSWNGDVSMGECSVKERNFGFSVDLSSRSRPVRRLASIVSQDSRRRSLVPATAFAEATEELEWEGVKASKSGKGDLYRSVSCEKGPFLHNVILLVNLVGMREAEGLESID